MVKTKKEGRKEICLLVSRKGTRKRERVCVVLSICGAL